MGTKLAEQWLRCGSCNCFLSTLQNYRTHFLMEHKTTIKDFGRELYETFVPEPSEVISIRPCQVHLLRIVDFQKNVNEKVENQEGTGPQLEANKPLKFQCEICNMRFLTPTYRNRHILTKHTKEKPFKCDKCEARFSRPDSLRSHSRTHSEKAYYSCEHCEKSFKFLSSYNDHKNDNHTAEEDRRKFICNLCPLHFFTRGKLATHERSSHNIEKSERYKCHICIQKFVSSSGLKNHILAHTGEKSYKCDQCNKTFTQKSNLTTHKKCHDRNRPRPFSCDKCDKTFTAKRPLTIHIEMVHDKVKKFWCGACGKGFTHKSLLNAHSKIHNDDIRSCKCDFCGKGFKRPHELRMHIRLHLDEKHYRCELCGKGYVQRVNLESHKQKCGKETTIGKTGRVKNNWNM